MWLALMQQDSVLPSRAYVNALRAVINEVNNERNRTDTLTADESKQLRELHAVLRKRVPGYAQELWGAAQEADFDASTHAAIEAAMRESMPAVLFVFVFVVVSHLSR